MKMTAQKFEEIKKQFEEIKNEVLAEHSPKFIFQTHSNKDGEIIDYFISFFIGGSGGKYEDWYPVKISNTDNINDVIEVLRQGDQSIYCKRIGEKYYIKNKEWEFWDGEKFVQERMKMKLFDSPAKAFKEEKIKVPFGVHCKFIFSDKKYFIN